MSSELRKRFFKEAAAAGLPAGPVGGDPIDPGSWAALPPPVQRYLHFMRVAGRPRDWSFRAGFKGRFRTKPGQRWMNCEAWQYSSGVELARLFHIRIRLAGIVPVLARDTYVRGCGRMLIRPFDLFTIEDGTGEEFDAGELVTWLNDAVMLAPSMLLIPAVAWQAVDNSSFDISLADHGRTVHARVTLDERGAPVNFSTTDRFYAGPNRSGRPVRTRWSTPMAEWQVMDGRPLPAGGQAVWQLPQGPFAYADFRLISGSIAFNVPPGS